MQVNGKKRELSPIFLWCFLQLYPDSIAQYDLWKMHILLSITNILMINAELSSHVTLEDNTFVAILSSLLLFLKFQSDLIWRQGVDTGFLQNAALP